jgi:microcystin-dependent protein
MNPYLGQITTFGGNYAPVGWAFCNGQLMSISQNAALFALLGTYFGGDGISTFALPNLQSAFPVHQGAGPGLTPYGLGEIGGVPDVRLLLNNLPMHMHAFNATKTPATSASIANTLLPGAPPVANAEFYAVQAAPPAPPLTYHTMAAGACGPGGQNLPHSNLMPSLCITFIIALNGIFPSRN